MAGMSLIKAMVVLSWMRGSHWLGRICWTGIAVPVVSRGRAR
jgi:hypothetical protein